MQDPPGLGMEPGSPAAAGRLFSTEPQGSPTVAISDFAACSFCRIFFVCIEVWCLKTLENSDLKLH